MIGNLIFLTILVSAAFSGNYRYPLPGSYPVGHVFEVVSTGACDFRVLKPIEVIDYRSWQINPWTSAIIFDEPGLVQKLETYCVHSIWETQAEFIPTDWLMR